LTLSDHQKHIADDYVSVQTIDPEQDRLSNWQTHSGCKMNTSDTTYENLSNTDKQFVEFDKVHPDEAYKKKAFTEWQILNFRSRIELHQNKLAEDLSQAELKLEEKK